MRPYQKIILVIGCVWAIVMPLMFVMDIAAGYEGKPVSTWVTTTLVPLLILWWPTGVLKHVIAWFKN